MLCYLPLPASARIILATDIENNGGFFVTQQQVIQQEIVTITLEDFNATVIQGNSNNHAVTWGSSKATHVTALQASHRRQ
jgi:hypothetical protein